MQRKTPFAQGEFYHLYNRGTDKREIFLDERDYRRFQLLLYTANSAGVIRLDNFLTQVRLGRTYLKDGFLLPRGDTLVDIGAYCLMPNHFHLLLQEKRDGGISSFMQKLATAYSMYFNNRNKRTGGLFEGRFKAKRVDTDEYLKYLFAYVHLNPIKIIEPGWKETGIADRNAAIKYLTSYSFSSYVDYTKKETRLEQNILTYKAFPQYFMEVSSFEHFIKEWLNFNSDLDQRSMLE
ncbi:MAG: hypothetical protein COZ49_01435 [Candidatus Yonathbacteria bacterium CG_4_10_14_3_um_filter_47_65]|uniref:Transposase IS200-like domain-containing protein n=2 Tax=Parcubacteria group TaxID=1794811 RepID=A0A2M8DAG7_9BACT|nr:MAG: hypothetical protein AUJ44_04140 [Candidatus Nomurabacteria bacterium CG1_02_47_685]PIP03648.1 MAG: hypothetical protein COX54_02835 [Candidatus Yonathbacteria bacterium CG23_combo_of_CG06-09_8_20_14_all_46_18]PIQ31791.1 MAG: hypothetical protein COW61_03220 [Candidatus Yonathbacteria bacterium CG17_big_fil_post_rev_8_21_14_2_50_46_19]PIX56555.1 MAG: hypothetical protein COZ49_01435 [Candidatus Yonathbacteria bacterium CG_4_10_14_3_um_filter_47_65]PIY57923.1 MAG: hypothetical protein CO